MNDTRCSHCGRTETVCGWALWRGVEAHLCHANPDGTRSNPDCYHLVTLGVEQLGARWNEAVDEAWGRVVDTMVSTFNSQLAAGWDAIRASLEMAAVGQLLAAKVGQARASGAAHELEFYGGQR